jgi:tRNA 2-thiouridine synthesizing protein D
MPRLARVGQFKLSKWAVSQYRNQEDHPNPKDWVAALIWDAEKRGCRLDWVQCGLCVDERGVGDWVPGPRRGSPGDFVKFVEESDNTLVIPTR